MSGIFICSVLMAQAQVRIHLLEREFTSITVASTKEVNEALNNGTIRDLIKERYVQHNVEMYFSEDRQHIFLFFNGFAELGMVPLKLDLSEGFLASGPESLKMLFTSPEGDGSISISFVTFGGPVVVELNEDTVILL